MASQALDLFDELLDLPEDERKARLYSLQRDNPKLAYLIGKLLAAAERPSHAIDRPAPVLYLPPSQHDYTVGSLMGRRFGSWKIGELIGYGGMGLVYRGKRVDGNFEQTCAIKVVRIDANDEKLFQKIIEERQTLARLSHPHIATLLDGGVEDGTIPWYAMELVDGLQIDEWCTRERLNVRSRIRMFFDVLDAVRYAHSQLVIHRDIKPSNVLVSKNGAVKLLDFGLSSIIDATGGSAVDQDDLLTPSFAAPEQFQSSPLSTSTDIYSIGLLLHLLLCGSHAFPTDSTRESMRRRSSTPAYQPGQMSRFAAELTAKERLGWSSGRRKMVRQLAGDLDDIMGKCLKERPEDRYTSVDQLVTDLKRWLDTQPISIKSHDWAYRMRLLIKRTRWPILSTFLLLLLLSLSLWQENRLHAGIDKERDTARQVNNLFLSLLVQNDAGTIGDPNFMVRKAIDTGIKHVEEDQYLAASAKSQIFSVFGASYDAMGLSEQAAIQFHKAIETAPPVSYERVIALLGMADHLTGYGNLAEADGMTQEASALTDKLSIDAPVKALLKAKSILLSAAIKGNIQEYGPEQVDQKTRQAQRLLLQSKPSPMEEDAFVQVVENFLLSKNMDAAQSALDEVNTRYALRGLPHSVTAIRLRVLQAEILRFRGELSQPAAILQPLLSGWSLLSMGERNPRTFALALYIEMLIRQGKFSDAVPYARYYRDHYTALYGPHNPDALIATFVLVECLRISGQDQEADSLLANLSQIQTRDLGPSGEQFYFASIAEKQLLDSDVAAAEKTSRDMDNGHISTAFTAYRISQIRSAICLEAGDYPCAITKAQEALKLYRLDIIDRKSLDTDPMALMNRRNVAVATIAMHDRSGYEMLDRLHREAMVRYGPCHVVTLSLTSTAPVFGLKALRAARHVSCTEASRSSGVEK